MRITIYPTSRNDDTTSGRYKLNFLEEVTQKITDHLHKYELRKENKSRKTDEQRER